MWRTLLVCAILLAPIGPAKSTSVSVTLDSYRQKNLKPSMKALNGLYLDGVREGMVTGVALLDDDSEPFCLPPELALTTEQAEDIMLRYADDHKVPGKTPIAIVLFMGLKKTFPCPRKK